MGEIKKLISGLEYDHDVLIGCGYEQRAYCYTTLVPRNTFPSLEVKPQRISNREDIVEYEEQTVCGTYTVAVPVGNDGMVTTYTQFGVA